MNGREVGSTEVIAGGLDVDGLSVMVGPVDEKDRS